MIIIARHRFVHEGGDLRVGEASLLGGLATAPENGEGVAIVTGQRDGDVSPQYSPNTSERRALGVVGRS